MLIRSILRWKSWGSRAFFPVQSDELTSKKTLF